MSTFKEYLIELDRSDLEWNREILNNKKKEPESAGSQSFKQSMAAQQPDLSGVPDKGSLIKTPTKSFVVLNQHGPILSIKELGSDKIAKLDYRKYKFNDSNKKTQLGKKIYILGK